jgi:hypothetical protein
MSPILSGLGGITVKGYGHFGPVRETDTGAMFPLQVITVGPAGASSVSFTNIPNTYTHLQVRAIGRTNRGSGATNDPFKLVFNSDTGNNYDQHYLQGDGSSASAFASINQGFIAAYLATATSATASVFGTIILDVLDYANTNKYKTTRALGGFDNNGSGIVALVSGNWRNTNAITSITITPQVGSNWEQYSQIALYGIKGA